MNPVPSNHSENNKNGFYEGGEIDLQYKEGTG
jgi:hypothetical protein